MLDDILQFIDSLVNRLPPVQGIPGKLLLDIPGSLPSEDAIAMGQAIANDCCHVDFDEW